MKECGYCGSPLQDHGPKQQRYCSIECRTSMELKRRLIRRRIDPEYRKKLNEASNKCNRIRYAALNPDQRRCRNAKCRALARIKCEIDPEYKKWINARMREYQKTKYAFDPEWRGRAKDRSNNRYHLKSKIDPEWLKREITKSKERRRLRYKNDPEYRERMKEASIKSRARKRAADPEWAKNADSKSNEYHKKMTKIFNAVKRLGLINVKDIPIQESVKKEIRYDRRRAAVVRAAIEFNLINIGEIE